MGDRNNVTFSEFDKLNLKPFAENLFYNIKNQFQERLFLRKQSNLSRKTF